MTFQWAVAGVLCVSLGLAATAMAQDAMPDLPDVKLPAPKPGIVNQDPPPSSGMSSIEDDLVMDRVVLGGLDKVTARVVTIEAPVGATTRFGQLEIVARACRQHRPEASPESAAFLDIWDVKPGEPAKSVFRGWMFASSPALSAMEHPIYDVWVLSCKSGTK